MTDGWYYLHDGRPVGPVSRAQLVAELLRSPNRQQEPVWKPGYSTWLEAGSIEELSSELARSHPEREVEYEHRSLRAASLLPTAAIYVGLAVLGTVGAIAYHFLF